MFYLKRAVGSWKKSLSQASKKVSHRSIIGGYLIGIIMHHFLDMLDLQRSDVEFLLRSTAKLKSSPRQAHLPLAGYCLGLVFEKLSLRTRVSFQAAMGQLGGTSIFLSG